MASDRCCPRTSVNRQVIERVVHAGTGFPENFHLHPKLRPFVDRRREAIANNGPIDWAFGEALAFGTLVLEGTPVRLSGQDSGRGTFSQRHLAFYDSETSRRYIPLQHVSPDQALRALLLPSDVSLYATPDMESRVVIRTSKGDTLTSKDYSSPRGTNGYYVYNAKWSPDSQFFVFSMTSSGGHSPWSYPTMVYSRHKNLIVKFSDMIDGKPTLSGDFSFSGPHAVVASTWKQPGALDDKVAVTVDLEEAFGKLPPSSD